MTLEPDQHSYIRGTVRAVKVMIAVMALGVVVGAIIVIGA